MAGGESDRPVGTAGRPVNDAQRRFRADDDGGGRQPWVSAILDVARAIWPLLLVVALAQHVADRSNTRSSSPGSDRCFV